MIVSAAQERELILSVLTGRGARPDTADLQARWLVEPAGAPAIGDSG